MSAVHFQTDEADLQMLIKKKSETASHSSVNGLPHGVRFMAEKVVQMLGPQCSIEELSDMRETCFFSSKFLRLLETKFPGSPSIIRTFKLLQTTVLEPYLILEGRDVENDAVLAYCANLSVDQACLLGQEFTVQLKSLFERERLSTYTKEGFLLIFLLLFSFGSLMCYFEPLRHRPVGLNLEVA